MQNLERNELNEANGQQAQKTLRLFPAILLASLLVLFNYALPPLLPETELFGFPLRLLVMVGGLLCAVGILIWWLFFSRAPWLERVGAIVVMVVALLLTRLLVHKSIAGAGMGVLLYVGAIPGLCLALVAGATVAQRFSANARRGVMAGALLLACVPWLLLRTAGILGAGSEYHWRWTPTPEERLLAQANDEPKTLPAATPTPVAPTVTPSVAPTASPSVTPSPAPTASATPKAEVPAAWPGFRGRNRDGVIRGVRIKTDWAAAPPVQLWRRPIGPGWSSFAVQGDLLYTQEQRGDDEVVGCYKITSGEPVWRHKDAVRFWESNAGAGPRATPTLHGNRVYSFGATGILNALDAATGKLVWTRNVATDTGVKVPEWGFASSPLIVDDSVIVAAAGTLAAYNLADGKPRWTGPKYNGSYSSPHRATLAGVPQIVLLGGPGAISVAPRDGAVLWEHKWQSGAIAQPALTADGDIVVNALAVSGGLGTRRLAVKQTDGKWTVEEKWTSNGLKPYFNDFVVHKGYAYGFDGNILASIDLTDGKRKWKGGRYGNGQLVLLPEQDVLLVLSEEGELALVSATTEQFKELARFPALNSKTWNHPALVGDVLLVRNGEEMAAFRLARESN